MSASYRSQTPQSQRQPASSSTTLDGTAGTSGAGGNKIPASPFITNPHGHPSFNPVKIGSKGNGDSKTPKQPKAPDKPLMPYMRYSRKVSRLVWDSVKASNPDLKLWEIGKIIGQMWRELSDDEKQEYLDEYDAEKLQYTEAMKVYHNSPAYQSWLSAKGKVDQEVESEEPEKTRRSKAPAGFGAATHVAESRSVTIQPCEDDDDGDEAYSVKHVAAARFHRNHCLINEIFSDAVVPDVRTVINEGRMAVLKRQVLSLTMHQKKLEGELEIIEQKHTNKKCQFSQSSEKFYEDLTKLCNEKPHLTDDQFSSMVFKAKDELKEKQRLAVQQQVQQQQQQLMQANSDTVVGQEASVNVNGDGLVRKTDPASTIEKGGTNDAAADDEQPMVIDESESKSTKISVKGVAETSGEFQGETTSAGDVNKPTEGCVTDAGQVVEGGKTSGTSNVKGSDCNSEETPDVSKTSSSASPQVKDDKKDTDKLVDKKLADNEQVKTSSSGLKRKHEQDNSAVPSKQSKSGSTDKTKPSATSETDKK